MFNLPTQGHSVRKYRDWGVGGAQGWKGNCSTSTLCNAEQKLQKEDLACPFTSMKQLSIELLSRAMQ